MSIIKKHLLSEKFLWSLLLLFSLLEILVFMVTPFIYQYFIDHVIENKDLTYLFLSVFLYFLSYVILVLFGFFKEVISSKLSQRIIQKTRDDYYTTLKRTKPTYLNHIHIGSEISVILNEINDVIEQYVVGYNNVIINSLRMLVACVILSVLNYKLLMILILCLPMYILLTYLFKNKIEKNAEEFNKIREGFTNQIHQGLEGYEDIIIFNKQEWDTLKVKNESRKYIKNRINSTMLLRAASDISYLFYWGVICVIYYFGAIDIVTGHFTLGLMLVYVAYLDNIYSPSRIILSSIASLKNAKSLSINFSNKIADMVKNEEKVPHDLIIPNHIHEIHYKKIVFQYQNDELSFFLDYFKLTSGKKIGFVGESGGGKTTLLKVISGLYQSSFGTIEIDQKNIHPFVLRDLTILCTQSPHLYSLTLEENINFSKYISDDQEMINLVYDELGIKEFINKKPMELSGGQYHRIALARTIISEAKLYIFDEPTANIDLEKRSSFYSLLNHLTKKGKIVIVSTHNENELSEFDQVYRINQGKLIELSNTK